MKKFTSVDIRHECTISSMIDHERSVSSLVAFIRVMDIFSGFLVENPKIIVAGQISHFFSEAGPIVARAFARKNRNFIYPCINLIFMFM